MKIVNKKGFTLVEILIGLAIASVVLAFGYNAGYKFYLNVHEKSVAENVKYKINQVITANDVGRGIGKKRIKSNNLVFRNNSNIIDNYYYTETFKIDPVTMVKSPVPTIEFYGMQRLKFSDDIKFVFPQVIEGTTLLNVPSEHTERLIINRITPDNEIKVFDGADNYFQIIDPADANLFRSDFTFLKGTKTLYQGKHLDNNIYYSEKKGVFPPTFINPEISVIYRGKKIGRIVIDTNQRKLVYISHFDEVDGIKGLTN